MASDQKLVDYAQQLPTIYQEILKAFPTLEPNRQPGYGLAFQTLATDFESRGLEFRLGEIIQACQQLQSHDIVEIKDRIFVHPTDFGERLIAAFTGSQPVEVAVPVPPV